MSKSIIKIAIVGDVHDLWQPIEDRLALQALDVDLVLFVGDFGNESIEVVQAIADLDIPKAAILGNHDAWYTAYDVPNKPNKKKCPYDRTQEDRVQQQLDILEKYHVGFNWLDFPEFDISVVGSRPFSSGSSRWKKAAFYLDRFGINSFAESTERIMHSVNSAAHDTIIFLGHNGPSGLGSAEDSICGKDWKQVGGDYGDPDFAEAIAKSYQTLKKVPLVTFGHMHHHLKLDSSRTRQAIATNEMGTTFLNSACSPRIIKENDQVYRNFSLVTLEFGKVIGSSLVWLDSSHNIVKETHWQKS
ncbi:MAG: TIGR04168 family protein [Oscillatoriales cyanobacterium CG2_30_44_21]|nr:MAG: TIGR04168 family protein [Oscillatoriales cyanobacterium CG2_30_44_21]